MKNEHLLYTGALAVFDDFSLSCNNFSVVHDTSNNNLNILRTKYELEQIAGRGDEFSQAINIMKWIYDNVWHNNGTKDVEFIPKDAMSILEYSFGKWAVSTREQSSQI